MHSYFIFMEEGLPHERQRVVQIDPSCSPGNTQVFLEEHLHMYTPLQGVDFSELDSRIIDRKGRTIDPRYVIFVDEELNEVAVSPEAIFHDVNCLISAVFHLKPLLQRNIFQVHERVLQLMGGVNLALRCVGLSALRIYKKKRRPDRQFVGQIKMVDVNRFLNLAIPNNPLLSASPPSQRITSLYRDTHVSTYLRLLLSRH
jgi:hypothetical protein